MTEPDAATPEPPPAKTDAATPEPRPAETVGATPEPPLVAPDAATPEPPPAETVGFQMSGRRVVRELALIVVVLGAVVLSVLWLARSFAARAVDSLPLEVDRTLGEQSARLLAMSATRCENPELLRYVDQVVAPLLAALDDHRFEFHFVVVDDPQVNAFALPGGFVTVNSGLLGAAQSGDEVAAVLAHELEHVLRRHGTQRMLRELGASALLSVLFGGTEVAVPAKVTHDFMSNAYDRAQESEADARGLELMVRAGLDPRGMARFFERLSKTSLAPPALLSTHPDPGDRAAAAARAAATTRPTTRLPPPPHGSVCRPQ